MIERLAHQYEKIDPLIVVESIEPICIDFQQYLDCLNKYLTSLADDDDTH